MCTRIYNPYMYRIQSFLNPMSVMSRMSFLAYLSLWNYASTEPSFIQRYEYIIVGSLSSFEHGQYLGVKSVFGQIQYLGTGVAGATGSTGSDFPYNCHTNHCERLIITVERMSGDDDAAAPALVGAAMIINTRCAAGLLARPVMVRAARRGRRQGVEG